MAKTVLIPAAGAGSRFAQAGITTPKPLITVQGRTLLEHTLDSFRWSSGDQLILAVQRQHRIRDRLNPVLQQTHPGLSIHWVELETLLPGQLATATAAVEACAIESDQVLLIHNCDTGFQWNEQLGVIEGSAAMAVFEAEGEHWSFGLPHPQDPEQAIAIAEKQRISSLASIGLYGFRSTCHFLRRAQRQLNQGETVRGEHFIAPMLQQFLEAGESVRLPRVNGVRLFGTPKELCATFGISLEQLKNQNLMHLNDEAAIEHPQDSQAERN